MGIQGQRCDQKPCQDNLCRRELLGSDPSSCVLINWPLSLWRLWALYARIWDCPLQWSEGSRGKLELQTILDDAFGHFTYLFRVENYTFPGLYNLCFISSFVILNTTHCCYDLWQRLIIQTFFIIKMLGGKKVYFGRKKYRLKSE